MLKQRPAFKRIVTVMITLCMVFCLSIPTMAKTTMTVCPRCHGNREIESTEICQFCGGTGNLVEHCDQCAGDGVCKETCPKCGGTGRGANGRECEECSGEGRVEVTCSNCHGTGTFVVGKCHICHGTRHRFIPCPDCHGTGFMD